MVLFIYLWEHVKKWASADDIEMRENHCYGAVGDAKPSSMERLGMDYQQMGGLRRLDSGNIRTHFYPEGGWGWIVCACAFLAHVTTSGAQLSAGALHIVLSNKFQDSNAQHLLGPLSWSVSSVCSPLVVNLCRRKNVRILSLVGGFLFPLSLLFTSFATELHQIFFSFGLVGGIGSCLVRESSGVVLGEYFRRRRHFVEQVVMAGTGVGVTLFSLLYLSLSRHIEWSQGFRIGAALSTICALLPAFYRTAAVYHPNRAAIQQMKGQRQTKQPGAGRVSAILMPLGGDICHSLKLFCVPSLKPVLWSATISSFGLYAPVFLMSDFGRKEGLSGGSLLLLQTHLGLGLSLGVILGAILTLKKFQCCQVSPRMLCCCTGMLTGLSMIAISSVKGYYGYSLSAWIYGIALGSYLYTLKILTMELTRTKHWGRIWSCVQSLMAPGILIGCGLTSYVGKPGFYACATCVLVGVGLIGFQLIDLSKCGSPQLSSVDNESPIPPAPPPITPNKYGHGTPTMQTPGMYPLRRSISLQQPAYPCCREGGGGLGYGGLDFPQTGSGGLTGAGGGYPVGYSPYCRECVMTSPHSFPLSNPNFSSMIRSYSLPQASTPIPSANFNLKTTGTQTNPNSPETQPRSIHYNQHQIYPGSFDRLPGTFSVASSDQHQQHHQQNITTHNQNFRDTVLYPELRRLPSYKNTVMFASNPQLFPTSTASERSSSSKGGADIYSNHYANSHHHHHHAHLHAHQHQQHLQDHYNNHGNNMMGKRTDNRDSRINFRNGQNQQNSFDEPGPGGHGAQYFPVVTPIQHHHQPTTQSQSQNKNNTANSNNAQSQQTHFHKQQSVDSNVSMPPQQQQPAFTRHYFDSSKILPVAKQKMKLQQQQQQHQQHQLLHQQMMKHDRFQQLKHDSFQPQQQQQTNAQVQQPLTTISSTSTSSLPRQSQPSQRQLQHQFHHHPRYHVQSNLPTTTTNPFELDADPPYYPASLNKQLSNASSSAGGATAQPTPLRSRSPKVTSSEFNVEQPKFNSLRRPIQNSSSNVSTSNANILPGIPPSRSSSPCPYCDLRMAPPPLSLSVPALQQYYGNHYANPMLRRRNTWHFHRDHLEAITTSV